MNNVEFRYSCKFRINAIIFSWTLIFNCTTILFGQENLLIEADSFVAIEKLELANELYDEVLKSNNIELDTILKLEVINKLGENLIDLENYHQAITLFNESLEENQNFTSSDSLIALIFHQKAKALYYLENYREAIDNWKIAIKIRDKFLPKNHIDFIKSYRNIGNGYYNLNQFENAKKSFKKSLELNLLGDIVDEETIAKTYKDLGSTFIRLEDFYRAEQNLKIALSKYNRLFVGQPWEQEFIYIELSDFYFLTEKPKKIVFYQKELLNQYKDLDDFFEEDYASLSRIYNNLALGYDLQDSLELSKYYNNQTLDLFKNGRISDLYIVGETYNNLHYLYSKEKDYKKANEALNNSILFFTKINDKNGLAYAFSNKALLLLKNNEKTKALETIDKAAKNLKDQSSGLVYDKLSYVSILNDKLKILNSLIQSDFFYSKDVLLTINEIQALLLQIRTDYQSDESKSFLSKKSKPIFENAIQAILLLHKQTQDPKYLNQAFQLAEQSKSIILMDALQQAQVRQTTNVPSELLNKEKELQKQIATKEKALFLGEEEATKLNNDLISLNQQLEKLTDTLKQNYPKYHEAKYATALPSINDIQNIIDNNLIEYFVGDSTIYVFKITKDQANIDYIEIPIDFPLADWIKQLREGIYQPHLQKLRSDEEEVKYAQDLVDIAHQLYAKLIAPIIMPSEKVEKLVIIPDGILGYIPFDVLITRPPEDATLFGAHDYLIKDFQISYAYSATSLIEMQKKEFSEVANKNFTAFAPTFEGTQEVAFVRSIDDLRGDLSPLEYNIPEVTAIQKLIGGSLFTGIDATRSNFIQNAANSKIVHLATHGKANDEKGDYAFLAFTDTKDSIDFKLYNRDLYNLALNADMVVLSACETGIGELQKGEGIISLARGFTYAGAKSIVTTLWSINDNRTKEIMENFYGNLKAGQTKDAALRKAKLDFIDNYGHNAHPFFWAAFIPIGDMEAIELGSNWTLKFGVIGIVGLLAFLFWWIRKTD